MAITRRHFLAGLGLTTASCASQVNLGGFFYPGKNQAEMTPQAILKRFFTNQAYEKMKDIPVLEPSWLPANTHGFASDGSFLHSLGGILCGIGTGRKIGYINSNPGKTIERLVHEYAHQGHYLGLVKEEEVMPHFATLDNWETKDHIHSKVMEGSKMTLAQKIVGVDKNSEIIANLAEYLIFNPGNIPRKLHQAFSKLLKISEEIVNNDEDYSAVMQEMYDYYGMRH